MPTFFEFTFSSGRWTRNTQYDMFAVVVSAMENIKQGKGVGVGTAVADR